MAVAAQMHNLDMHSTVGSAECTGSHYALAAAGHAGIARYCKNIQDIVDTFDMMQGCEDDASIAVDCWHDNIVMIAEVVDKEILHHSSDQMMILALEEEVVVVVVGFRDQTSSIVLLCYAQEYLLLLIAGHGGFWFFVDVWLIKFLHESCSVLTLINRYA